MPKLSAVGYGEFARKLVRGGYLPIRKSKHTVYYHPEKRITIPFSHKHSRDIPRGLFNKLLKEMKISKEEFEAL